MLDHISIGVAELGRSATFYDACLSALGYVRVWTIEHAVGYGPQGGGDKFAIKSRPGAGNPSPHGFHIAFTAQDSRSVDAFYSAALAHGGEDNGEPGLRPKYGPGYYAAFVIDPDGHPIEAVWHDR